MSHPTSASSSSGLDPVVIAKIAPLELRARKILDGALSGRHRSRRLGQALEFAGHRAYTPSDDWRRVDWKAYAKTDRWLIREQEEETALTALLLLDASASMEFHSPRCLPKGRYGALLLSALGYLLIHNREYVGLGFFSGAVDGYWPPHGGVPQLSLLLESLDKAAFHGKTNWRPAFEAAGQRLKRRSLVIVVSDFLGPAEEILSSVKVLLAKKNEVVAFQVLDPVERTLDLDGDIIFEDLETAETLTARAESVAPLYRQEFDAHQAKLGRGLASLGVDHWLFSTERPLDEELSLFLRRRGG